ncbi:hypothetical protein AB0L06_09885 [Spirillospora sp. NPDC052269]
MRDGHVRTGHKIMIGAGALARTPAPSRSTPSRTRSSSKPPRRR